MQKNEKIVNKVEFYKLFEQFKKDCNCKIDKNLFYNIYYNAKFIPYYNSFSDVTSYPYYLKSIYLKTKGKLPQAIRNLYKNINKSVQKITVPNDLEIKILNELNSKGFFVIENFLNETQINQILKELKVFDYHSINSDTQKIKFLRENYNKKNQQIKSNLYYSYMTDEIIKKDSEIGKLLLNNFMERVSTLYFNSQSFLVGLVSFFTSNNTKDEPTGDQKFHFDYSHLSFLKFFLYLDDVNEKNGPHVCIEQSHEDNFDYPQNEKDFEKNDHYKIFPNGEKEGYISDEYIAKKNYKKKFFLAPKGTLIIENTTNIHKGMSVLEKKREMLSFIYAISAIGKPTPIELPTIDFDPENVDNYIWLYQVLKKNKEDCIKKNKFFKKKNNLIDNIKLKFFSKYFSIRTKKS